jgi:hypothetical protein
MPVHIASGGSEHVGGDGPAAPPPRGTLLPAEIAVGPRYDAVKHTPARAFKGVLVVLLAAAAVVAVIILATAGTAAPLWFLIPVAMLVGVQLAALTGRTTLLQIDRDNRVVRHITEWPYNLCRGAAMEEVPLDGLGALRYDAAAAAVFVAHDKGELQLSARDPPGHSDAAALLAQWGAYLAAVTGRQRLVYTAADGVEHQGSGALYIHQVADDTEPLFEQPPPQQQPYGGY